ncbi:MAG: hypothetical protein QNJ85_11385 [Gammaproteobacteria bacterium]|nr:hypothetical protein [Gammaproteobacteria bacterium]
MNTSNRPDLSARQILSLLALIAAVALITLAWPDMPAPGSTLGQGAAAFGALLLLAPLAFTLMKRSGLAASPPAWFVAHVVATSLGICLIFLHVAAGNWLTPAGLVLLCLVFLVFQGGIMRSFIADEFALLFARTSAAQGFTAPARLDKTVLQAVIDAKTALLRRLDPAADESLFSPALKHWFGSPLLSLRYQLLADREAGLVGARASAGGGLRWWRRLHMLVALAFYAGLVAHVIVMLFFAGYAAGDGPIDWWHITAWGR